MLKKGGHPFLVFCTVWAERMYWVKRCSQFCGFIVQYNTILLRPSLSSHSKVLVWTFSSVFQIF